MDIDDTLESRVLSYLEKMRVPDASWGTFRISVGNPPDLFASCYAVFILELFDKLGQITDEQRDQWQNVISSVQREYGLFDDPNSRFKHWDNADEELNLFLETGLAICALSLLERSPRFPLRFLNPYLSEKGLKQWLRQRQWKRKGSWYESTWRYCHCWI